MRDTDSAVETLVSSAQTNAEDCLDDVEGSDSPNGAPWPNNEKIEKHVALESTCSLDQCVLHWAHQNHRTQSRFVWGFFNRSDLSRERWEITWLIIRPRNVTCLCFVCFGKDSHQRDAHARHSHHREDRRDAETAHCVCTTLFYLNSKSNKIYHSICQQIDKSGNGSTSHPLD